MFSLEVQLDNDDLPEDWVDDNIIDFINHLLVRKKKKRLGYKSDFEVKNHPYFKNIPWAELENMTFESPFVFDTEDNFDDSYAQKQDNDSIYEGKKELYIIEVNESMTFKNFYFNIEEKIAEEEVEDKDNDNATNINVRRKDSKKGTKTHTTSKTSTKKVGEDNSIVIHNLRGYSQRKSARFKGIIPDSGKQIVNVLRKDSKSGTLKLNQKDNNEDN
jgi:hypothetical protein